MFTDLTPRLDLTGESRRWFSRAPEIWRVYPMRWVFQEIRDDGHPHETMLSVTISRGVIRQEDFLSESSKRDASNLDKSKYKLVRPGDIVYNKMRAWQGALGASRHRGIVSPAYIVLRPRRAMDSIYLHHLLRVPAFAREAERWSYGISSDQWSLRPEQFKMIACPVPPPGEQAAIARYLFHANLRIDKAIAAKRRLIALLEEQKRVVINHAVTRGLNPNVPMKDSDIPWLGDIPAHWSIPLLGQCLMRIEQGWSPTAAEGELVPDQWAVLTLSAISGGTFSQTSVKPIPVARDVPTHLEVKQGDLLMSRSNTRTRVGDAVIAVNPRRRTIFSDLIYRISPRLELADREYVAALLQSPFGRAQIERDARGSSGTMPKISHSHIRSWRVPLPPLNEQAQITLWLTKETRTVDAAIARSHREIDLLREFRTRLTADVVTGQVDVREIAARLPDIDVAQETSAVLDLEDDDDLDAEAQEYVEEAFA